MTTDHTKKNNMCKIFRVFHGHISNIPTNIIADYLNKALKKCYIGSQTCCKVESCFFETD